MKRENLSHPQTHPLEMIKDLFEILAPSLVELPHWATRQL
jgi:hypothetical protein